MSPAFFISFSFSMASRRMARMATLASSPSLETSLVSSLRRSSLRGGNTSRMTLPSFWGFTPRSEVWMAFSMPRSTLMSQGWMVSTRASVTETAASWLMGVGVS